MMPFSFAAILLILSLVVLVISNGLLGYAVRANSAS